MNKQPRRHRMRRPARLDSARQWVRSGARVTVGAYAKRYGVDRYTAYDELTAIGFPLPASAQTWAQRPPPVPRKRRRRTDEVDDPGADWVWIGDRRMFVVDYTPSGVPFGPYEDEFTDPGSILEVSDETRDRVLRIGREEFGGASADETVRRLIDEHRRARAVAAVHHYRGTDPQGWAEYLAHAEEMAGAEAPVTDEWAGDHE